MKADEPKTFTEVGLEALRQRAKKNPLPAGQRVFYSDSGSGAVGGFKIRQSGSTLAYGVMARFDGKNPAFRVVGRVGAISLKDARAKARDWLALLDQGLDPSVIEEQTKKAREAAEAAQERERLATEAAKKYTLSALIVHYLDHLDKQGKDAADAKQALAKNVIKAQPELAALPAREVTRSQVTAALRAIVEAGHGRMAAKVRSYLRAAYALALRAEGDATAPHELIAFAIEANPVSDTAPLSQFNKARDRALNEAELRAYWKRISTLEGLTGDAARLQLLLGGQRWEQLLRAEAADYDPHAKTLTLRDPKGKRTTPRLHVLPLVDDAAKILKRLAKQAAALESAHLFSLDGKTQMHQRTVAKVIEATAAAMVEAGEAQPFMPSDIRRSVETRLAAMGISREVRGQLQSHGLSGVQVRHYDRHGYMDEKRAAIEALVAFLNTEPAANVVALRKKTKQD